MSIPRLIEYRAKRNDRKSSLKLAELQRRTARNPLFVSHVAEDSVAALNVVDQFESRGIRCWVAPRDVSAGGPVDDQIAAAIDRCVAMLLIFSRRSNQSAYIRREVGFAGDLGKLIIPFRIANVGPERGLKVRLGDLHWVDAFDARVNAVEVVIRALVEKSTRHRRFDGH